MVNQNILHANCFSGVSLTFKVVSDRCKHWNYQFIRAYPLKRWKLSRWHIVGWKLAKWHILPVSASLVFESEQCVSFDFSEIEISSTGYQNSSHANFFTWRSLTFKVDWDRSRWTLKLPVNQSIYPWKHIALQCSGDFYTSQYRLEFKICLTLVGTEPCHSVSGLFH